MLVLWTRPQSSPGLPHERGRFAAPDVRSTAAVVALVLLTAACGGDDSPTEPESRPVATVTVAPTADTIAIGGSTSLTATTRDAEANVLTDRPITWSSSNPTAADVDTAGRVTALDVGSAIITARSEGKTGAAEITVVILDPDVYELIVVSGGGQSGFAGTVLAEPLVAKIRRITSGTAKEGVPVTWRVVSGSGEPTRTSSATDPSGEASTRIALGNATGQVTAEAQVVGLEPARFAALIVLPAPTIVAVSPASADPGDVVDVTVDDLPQAAVAEVLFDGVAGNVVDRVDGSPAVLKAEVLAPVGVCSSTTVPVEVRVRVDGITTSPENLTVSVPADPFQVGQVLVIEGTTDVQCALLPAGSGNAKYLLIPMSAEFEVNQRFQVTLGGQSVAITAAGAQPSAGLVSFHSRLRAFERQLALRGLPPAQPPADAQLFAGPSVGDTRHFWVLNDVDATADGQLTEDEFDRIQATLKFAGANSLLYVDNASPQPGLTQADIDALGRLYDLYLYPVDLDYFGEPSDVDNNDKVVVTLTPTVNGLTDRGAGGVIVGFFFGLDLFAPNAPGCPECAFSNGSELFYGLVPDPGGDFSDPRTRERVLELLPGVMAHETQHMINFRYKVFETTPATLETLWLSEGMAHMAEELAGDAVDADDPDLADDLYLANFGRTARYLEDPESFSLTATSGNGSLGERGTWWLFLRWMADQYGDFIFRDLTQASANGVANVEAQTGESFFRLFADYMVATWADDLDIPGIAQRYQVPKWQLRSILRQDPPGGGEPEYILQPLQETFATFRSSSITQFITGSSGYYVELDAAGDTSPLQLELTTAVSAGLAILRFQ